MARRIVLLCADLVLIAFATLVSFIVRDNLALDPDKLPGQLAYTGLTLLVSAPLLLAVGLPQSIWRFTSSVDYRRIGLLVPAIVLAALAARFIIDRLDTIPRSIPLLQAAFMMLFLSGPRALARRSRHQPRRQDRMGDGFALSTKIEPEDWVLVVGLNRVTELYLETVREFEGSRMNIVGILGRSSRHTGRLLQGRKILGTAEQVLSVVDTLKIHGVSITRIVLTTPIARLSAEARSALLTLKARHAIAVDAFADFLQQAHDADEMPSEQSIEPTISFRLSRPHDPASRFYWPIKRGLDILCAACLLALLFPVMLAVALLTAVDHGPGIFFWQQRPGYRGNPLRVYKFRTMRAAFDASGNRIPDQKRCSAIGNFLRRSRLDELPQLYNILAGHMSFVGPRPLLPQDQPAGEMARLVVRPGLTGWAQIRGGRSISANDKAALDIWYVTNASFMLDMRILFSTIPMVLFGERVSREAIKRAWLELQESGICANPALLNERNFAPAPAIWTRR